MHRTPTVTIIGAGQAGLAMSRCLTDRSIDNVLLERGDVANSWRSERWDSLRLLTPNWMTRLPGFRYRGDDPDGYLTKHEVVSSSTASAPMRSSCHATSRAISTRNPAVPSRQATPTARRWTR